MSVPQAFRTMILPAPHVTLARSICATLAPSGGSAMFAVGLSPDGQAPATHYVSTGFIDEDFANLMPLVSWYELDGEWHSHEVSPGSAETVVYLCAEAGLEVALADVEALFLASDVTEQEPFVAFGRLGLQLVSDEAVAS